MRAIGQERVVEPIVHTINCAERQAIRIDIEQVVRANRYRKDGGISAHPPSSIPFLALGAWVLAVGWFGFNVMSAQTVAKISGLVAVNSLMAMVGGTLVAVLMGRNDPGFAYNGPLAGLVAVCAGSDVMHPAGAPVVAL